MKHIKDSINRRAGYASKSLTSLRRDLKTYGNSQLGIALMRGDIAALRSWVDLIETSINLLESKGE